MRAARFDIPSRLSRVALVASCALAGCKSEPTEPIATEEPEQLELAWSEERIGGAAVLAVKPIAIKEGVAPLVYLADSTVMVRVMDQTNNLILAETVVSPRTIVRIDDENGVIAGSEQLYAGPLPAGRRYGIYIVPETQSYRRTGTYEKRPDRQRQ